MLYKTLITRVSLNTLNCAGMPVSQLLGSVLASATLMSSAELFIELAQQGFAPHWESDTQGLIWICDPNVGAVLLHCEQSVVTLH